MTRELQKELMDIDSPGRIKSSQYRQQENGFNLYPVSVNDSGEGLPYAPEDWPNPGDKWVWKVGRRIALSGYFYDRYLYPPGRLRWAEHKSFKSKVSVEKYIQEKFPDKDVDAFFASFSWRIPSKPSSKDDKEMIGPQTGTAEDRLTDVQIVEMHCKAGNKLCSSLNAPKDSISKVMFCDICCIEPGFCRDCCCILCCQSINKAGASYSYIRCDAKIEGSTCGHRCHLDCALRAYMAGTVGGSISLDAEYYCRRCDSRTDLVSHFTKLLQNIESNVSRDEMEKILEVGISVLRGSEKTSVKQLLHHIELSMSELKNGASLEEIWKKEDMLAITAGLSPNANGASGSSSPHLEPLPSPCTPSHQSTPPITQLQSSSPPAPEGVDSNQGLGDGSQVPPSSSHKVYLKPEGTVGYRPSKEGTSCIATVIRSKLNAPYKTWKDIPEATRRMWFQEWKRYVHWEPQFERHMQKAFNFKGGHRLRDMYSEARANCKKPIWMSKEVWDGLSRYWASPSFQKKSVQAKKNRASQIGRSPYTGGCISPGTHADRMARELKRPPTKGELLARTRKRKTERKQVDEQSREANEDVQQELPLSQKSQPQGSDEATISAGTQHSETAIQSKAVGGGRNKKSHICSSYMPPANQQLPAATQPVLRAQLDHLSQKVHELNELNEQLLHMMSVMQKQMRSLQRH